MPRRLIPLVRSGLLVWPVVLALMVAACGNTQDPGQPDGDVTNEQPDAGEPLVAGALRLEHTGLPDELEPRFVVVGPEGYSNEVTGTGVLEDLVSGEYRVTPLTLPGEGGAWITREGPTTVELGEQGASVRFEFHLLRAVVPDTTHSLDAEQTQEALEVAELDDEGGTLTFDGAPPQLQELEEGEIVALGVTEQTPHGYLGRVVRRFDEGGRVTLETERVPVAEAVTQGAGSALKTYGPSEMTQLEPLIDGMTFSTRAPLSFAGVVTTKESLCIDVPKTTFSRDDLVGSGGVVEGNGTLTIEGETCIAPGVVVRLSLTENDADFSFELFAGQVGSLDVSGDGELAFLVRMAVPLVKIQLQPVVIQLGRVPVIVVPVLLLYMEVGGSINGRFTLQAEGVHSRVGAGLRYVDPHLGEPYVEPILSHSFTGRRKTTGAVGGFSLRAGVGPGLDLFIYGVAGPSVSVVAYMLYDVQFNRDPWWRLSLGLDAWAGVKLNLIKLTPAIVNERLFDVSMVVAEGPPGQTQPVIVEVSPKTIETTVCTQHSFEATVSGATADSIEWSTPVGLLEADGLNATFDVPGGAGSYEIRVESTEQDGQADTALVNVTGSAGRVPLDIRPPEGGGYDLVLTGGPLNIETAITDGEFPDCLPTGDYVLHAKSVVSDGKVHFVRVYTDDTDSGDPALVTAFPFTVREGLIDNPAIHVSYVFQPSSIDVEFDGNLVDHADVAVELTGPLGYQSTITKDSSSRILLNPGEYRLTAPDLVYDGKTYAATVTANWETGSGVLDFVLEPGDTMSAVVEYKTTSPLGLWVASYKSAALFSDLPASDTTAAVRPPGISYMKDLRFDALGRLWTLSGRWNDVNTDVFEYVLHRFPADKLTQSPQPELTIPLPTADRLNYSAMAFDDHGDLWVANDDQQLLRYDAASLSSSSATPEITASLAGFTGTPQSIEFDPEGNLWLADSDLHRLPKASLAAEPIIDLTVLAAEESDRFRDLAFAPDGSLWVVTVFNQTYKATLPTTDGARLTRLLTVSVPGTPMGLVFSPAGDLYVSAHNPDHNMYSQGVHRFFANDLFRDLSGAEEPTGWAYGDISQAHHLRWRDAVP